MTNNFSTAERALEHGVAAHRAGRLTDAEQAYRAALEADPGHVQALYLLGTLQLQQGRPAQGEQLLARAIAASPGEPTLHQYHGIALAALKRFAEAVTSFDRAVSLKPEFADALVHRGVALGFLGRQQEAVASFERATALEPGHAGGHYHCGVALLNLGRPSDAISRFDRVVALKPEHAEAWLLRGVARLELNQFEAAIAECDHMIAHHRPRAELFLLRADALLAAMRFQEAIADYDRAIALKPDLAEAFVNRGNAHYACRRLTPALADYDRAIALKPDFAEAFLNRGNAHFAEQRFTPALADYDRAIALQPAFWQAHLSRAKILATLDRSAEAIAACDRAIALAPRSAEAFAERATLLTGQGRQAEAVTDYRRAIGLNPDLDYVQGGYLRAKMHVCDWSDFDADCATLFSHVASGKVLEAPFALLFVASSAQLQRQCAERFVADKYPSAPPLWQGAVYRHPQIRLAYLSSTFRDHPTTILMGGLFARHDKAGFETTALSFGPNDGSASRRQLESAFDRFLDVAERSDQEIAERIRSLEIDILVDLDGFVDRSRPGILARRAAPVQVNYLGYPGTLGALYVDYIIADPVLIGAGDEHYYTEKIVRLPDSYQPNSNRPPPAAPPARAALGLPEKGFVFCSFNNHYKITPQIFDVWMRLLNQVPGSVLWLLANDAARTNLRREAARRGVDPERLVFAPIASQPEHLARLPVADLFLDTLYYNAHTTASDALWMGLPLVTCRGETFAGRVAASLLRAAGLPELVTESLADYEALALRLARDPALLRAFRERLAKTRDTSALFDSDRFLRHLETAYMRMAEIAGRGEGPRSFDLPE